MMKLLKPAIAAGIAFSAMAVAAPASAQVNGMASVDLPLVVAASQARVTGAQTIATQYAAQLTTIQQRAQQRQQLIQQFDTNGDGQLSEAEQAPAQDENNATVRQIQAIDQEIQTLQTPIQMANLFVVSQVGQQLSAAVQQVLSDKNIQVLLTPESLIQASDEIYVTDDVTAALNTRFPQAAVTPPANWQPSESVVNLFQQVQQVLRIAQLQQQQAAAAQQPAASGR